MRTEGDKGSKSVAVIGSGYWGKNLVRNFYRDHLVITDGFRTQTAFLIF